MTSKAVKRIPVFLVCLPRCLLQQFPNSQIKPQLSGMGNSAVQRVIPREKCASLENAIFHIIFPSYTSFRALLGFAGARAGYYGVCVAAREATHTPRAQGRRELPAQDDSNCCDAARHASQTMRCKVGRIQAEILQFEFPSSKSRRAGGSHLPKLMRHKLQN